MADFDDSDSLPLYARIFRPVSSFQETNLPSRRAAELGPEIKTALDLQLPDPRSTASAFERVDLPCDFRPTQWGEHLTPKPGSETPLDSLFGRLIELLGALFSGVIALFKGGRVRRGARRTRRRR